MIRKLTFIAVALALGLVAAAQKEFTLEDLNFGGNNYRNMIPQNRTIVWWGDTPVRLSADTVWTVNPKTGAEKLLFTRAALPTDGNLSALSWAEFPYAGKPIVKLIDGDYLVLIDFKAHKTLFKMKNDAAVSEWHPVSRNMAYIEGDNLWVARAEVNMAPPSSVTTPAQRQEFDDHMRVQRLTTDGSRDIVYGQAVHRNEFGIEGGLFWNPQ
ncbi:MAG: DPP IV N-terminal domain-containing protein, partial [Muribaculaceae bacterium]|nr:DPP IV N-terminal domain-containing protein [Muribaculaceae bacterium]